MASTVTLNQDHLVFELTVNGIDGRIFKAKGCKIIQVGSLKGIVFNFTNDNLTNPFFTNVPGTSLNLKAIVNNTNKLNWNVNDDVRIMYLNEIDYRDFEKLIPYFEARLSYYQYSIPTPGSGLYSYSEFSKIWSSMHRDNPVDDMPMPPLSPIPRQTHNDDILRIV